jgi:phage-related protein
MPNIDNQTIELAIVAVIALAVLLQAFVLLAIFVALRKAAHTIEEKIEDLRSSVMPVVDSTRELIARMTPKVETTVDDLAVIVHRLREQTAQVESSAKEILERVRRQTSRVDAMLTTVLDTVDRAGGFINEAISKPMRQLSALLASVKAIVESLRESESAPRSQPTHPSDDEDRFV